MLYYGIEKDRKMSWREREKERQTDRQTDRVRETDRQSERDRQTKRQREVCLFVWGFIPYQ